ncbi:MAG: hypothetical protein HQK49_07435 [Oligoflexia bacterium]|nr:hypothetical protein [Oligoflexia bacterium]
MLNKSTSIIRVIIFITFILLQHNISMSFTTKASDSVLLELDSDGIDVCDSKGVKLNDIQRNRCREVFLGFTTNIQDCLTYKEENDNYFVDIESANSVNVCTVIKNLKESSCGEFNQNDYDKQNRNECNQLNKLYTNNFKGTMKDCGDSFLCKGFMAAFSLPAEGGECSNILEGEAVGICYALRDMMSLNSDKIKKQINFRKQSWVYNKELTLSPNDFITKIYNKCPENEKIFEIMNSSTAYANHLFHLFNPLNNYIEKQYIIGEQFVGKITQLYNNLAQLEKLHLKRMENYYVMYLKELVKDPKSIATTKAYQRYLQHQMDEFHLIMLLGKTTKLSTDIAKFTEDWIKHWGPAKDVGDALTRQTTGYIFESKYLFSQQELINNRISKLEDEMSIEMNKLKNFREMIEANFSLLFSQF